MSEINLNEEIEEVVDDATVITVNIDNTLSVSGEAADAKAVGDALADKVDADDVMQHVTITFDGIPSDNQGVINAFGDDIPIDDTNNAPKIKAYIDTVAARTGADIAVSGSDSTKISAKFTAVEGQLYGDQLPLASGDSTKIATAISNLDAKTASDIPYITGTSIKDKVDAVDGRLTTVEGAYISKNAQTLTTDQKAQVRTNIGCGDAATQSVANNLTTVDSGSVLDARQGKALSDTQTTQAGQITVLQNRINRVNLSDQITFDNLGGSNTGTYQTDTLLCYRYGNVCHLEFGLKFSSSQSANSVAFAADFHGLPKMAGTSIRGVCGTVTYSLFSYNMDSSYRITVRFVYNGSNAGTTNTYTQVIEYIIDDNAGGGEESTPEET